MANDRLEREANRGKQSWSVEIDLEAAYGEFHSTLDVGICVDSCSSYLKILADVVAKTIPSIFGAPPFRVSRESMNSLWNNALQQPDTPLGRLFNSAPRDWLDILSAARNRTAGIRDSRVHHGALNSVMGHAVGEESFRAVVSQWSVGKERDGDRAGETIRDSVLHSDDAVSDLIASTAGLFSFLDKVVRKAALQNHALSPVREAYSKAGYALAFGPSTFLTSMLPAV